LEKSPSLDSDLEQVDVVTIFDLALSDLEGQVTVFFHHSLLTNSSSSFPSLVSAYLRTEPLAYVSSQICSYG
jgi:hypothetical protein